MSTWGVDGRHHLPGRKRILNPLFPGPAFQAQYPEYPADTSPLNICFPPLSLAVLSSKKKRQNIYIYQTETTPCSSPNDSSNCLHPVRLRLMILDESPARASASQKFLHLDSVLSFQRSNVSFRRGRFWRRFADVLLLLSSLVSILF